MLLNEKPLGLYREMECGGANAAADEARSAMEQNFMMVLISANNDGLWYNIIC
jgi:hypothetical protein